MNQRIRYLTKEFLTNTKQYLWFLIFIALYMLYFFIFHDGVNCLVKITIGLPCPGCGMTRAVLSFIRFDFVQAFHFHPLVFLLPVLFIVLFFKNVPTLNRVYTSKVFWGTVLVLYIMVYIIRMVSYYPNVEPMDHYHQSILDSIIH